MAANTPGASAPDQHERSIRISGPSGLVAAVPYLLGFDPQESVVVVFTRAPRSSVVLSLRVDLPEAGTAARIELASEIGRTVERAVKLGAQLDRAQLAVFSRLAATLPAAELVAELGETLRRKGLAVAESLSVAHDRWWSYDCREVGCPPCVGHAIDDAPGIRAAFDLVTAGLGYVADRATLARQLTPDRDSFLGIADIGTALAACRRHADSGRESVRWRRSVENDLLGWLTSPGAPSEGRKHVGPSDRELARWACSLADSRVREPVLHRLLFEGGARRRPQRLTSARIALTALVPRVPDPEVAAPAALLAAVAWQQGDGAFARLAGERALTADSGSTLARLVVAAAGSGVPPSEWSTLMARFTPAMLRGTREVPADIAARRSA